MNPEVTVLRTRERGHADVAPAIWRDLAGSPEFWTLVESGVVTVSQPARSRMRVSGTRFVGVARLGEVQLEIHEKVPGALRALIGFATSSTFRVERAAAPESEFGDLTALLVHHFLVGLRSYVSRGREFRFGTERAASPFVRGRLDVVQTLRLRSKGLGHLVAFDRNVQDFRTPLNLVLFAALRQVEILARLIPIPEEDLAKARSMALFFSDCRTAAVVLERRTRWAERAEALLRDSRDPKVKDLVSLAAVLLARQGFEDEERGDGLVPRSWFLNLEDLFESAVRRLFQDLAPPGTSISNGKTAPIPIFPMSANSYRAQPDVVVRLPDATTLIGDVKHKEWTGAAAASDLYQLLVHAETYGATSCFLVYPGDALVLLPLGRTSGGVDVLLACLDVRSLDLHAGELLRALGVLKPKGDLIAAVA